VRILVSCSLMNLQILELFLTYNRHLMNFWLKEWMGVGTAIILLLTSFHLNSLLATHFSSRMPFLTSWNKWAPLIQDPKVPCIHSTWQLSHFVMICWMFISWLNYKFCRVRVHILLTTITTDPALNWAQRGLFVDGVEWMTESEFVFQLIFLLFYRMFIFCISELLQHNKLPQSPVT
jgi:hypothetical protein